MPTAPENSASLRQRAESHADEILGRLAEAHASRTAALQAHPNPINVRTELTRAAIPRTAAAAAAPAPAITTNSQTAGYLLAIGDSWFDYPIRDVLTNLEDHYGYNVESSAHKGDPIETMVSHVGQLDKFGRCMQKVVSQGASPKAVLVSGGGDDIAGNEFGMLLDDIDLNPTGWNDLVLQGVIDTRIANAYRRMFFSVNRICQQFLHRTVPILAHGYDYPVPDGRGFLGGWGPLPGPWLKPGMDEKLFLDLAVTTKMMIAVIDRFNAMLQRVAAEPGFENVHYIDLRNTLSNQANYKDYWANELHPTGGDPLFPGKNGFLAVAAKFQAQLIRLPLAIA